VKESNKLWRYKFDPITDLVELPDNAVILGIDHKGEEDDSAYLDYLVPATDAETRLHELQSVVFSDDAEEGTTEAWEEAHKAVTAEREVERKGN